MMKRRAKVDYARWVFVLPALLVVGILLIYPIFSSLYYSMTTKHLIRLTYDFIGLENYKAVLADPNFFKAFLNSVLWTLGSLAGQLIIGFTGALAINRVNFGKGIYRTLMIIPWAFPSIVIALSWKWILNGVSGFIPNILVQLGICNELPQFLSDNSFVFLTLIFINIWFGAPMIMVNVLSALQTIPQDQYEAAQIDGASKVQQFWYITVPHIKVVVGLLVVLRTIWVFNNFDIIYLLTGGGPANATTTMPIYAYNMGWNTKLLGRSSAVTMLLLAFLLLVCVIYFTIIGKWEKEDIGSIFELLDILFFDFSCFLFVTSKSSSFFSLVFSFSETDNSKISFTYIREHFPYPLLFFSINPIPCFSSSSFNVDIAFPLLHFNKSIMLSNEKYINTFPSLSFHPFSMDNFKRSSI